MLVAVTSSDETNMVACQVAYSLFNTPNRIARIRSPDYVRDADKLFHSDAVPIDHLIAPEQLVIDNIYRLIEYPGALQVVNFAEGKVSLAVVKAYYGGPLIGNALSTMREHMPHIDTRVAAISATIAPFVRKVRPLLKLVMKCSLLPLHSISAR